MTLTTAMTLTTVEMLIEPGAEALLTKMGKRMNTRARSKVIDRALVHIRELAHSSDVAAWFSELRFAPSRRTTVRISADNDAYLNTLAQLIGRGRPSILLDLVYFAAANLRDEDYEALR